MASFGGRRIDTGSGYFPFPLRHHFLRIHRKRNCRRGRRRMDHSAAPGIGFVALVASRSGRPPQVRPRPRKTHRTDRSGHDTTRHCVTGNSVCWVPALPHGRRTSSEATTSGGVPGRSPGRRGAVRRPRGFKGDPRPVPVTRSPPGCGSGGRLCTVRVTRPLLRAQGLELRGRWSRVGVADRVSEAEGTLDDVRAALILTGRAGDARRSLASALLSGRSVALAVRRCRTSRPEREGGVTGVWGRAQVVGDVRMTLGEQNGGSGLRVGGGRPSEPAHAEWQSFVGSRPSRARRPRR
ncbi:hypothetical protein DFJ69_6031 [Thermomonospora umbrina]|uniref:Uncharacterized protein n=1 Tax=Thermomonospora umbrina TaxID=111806 RepID=A0A3D9SY45_9ACTN|nr:hypothetical protein DFJ69_6031 [Thermomonospora umbrina]